MARREIAPFCSHLLCLALSGVLLAPIRAEETGKPPAQPNPAPAPAHPNRKETDPLVQLVRSLTPEQKTRLIESIKTWQELTPEVKQALRARETTLKKSITDEIDAALGGTEISQEQKALFEKRYKEERRNLDQSLRAELDTRRKAGLQDIIAKIKAELSLSGK